MDTELPREIERFIIDTVRLNADRMRVLKKDLRSLSERFAISASAGPELADAYFAYNFPLNFMKAYCIGEKLHHQRGAAFKKAETISILDVGCGEGAGMYGLYQALRETGAGRRYRMTGIDSSAQLIARSRALGARLSKVNRDCTVDHRSMDISADLFRILSEERKRFDLIIFSNSLIEIIKARMLSLSFIGEAFACLNDRGTLIMIEPALKDCARRLMGLRNIIAREGKYEIIMPCGHKSECPLLALEDQEEWCHFSVPWRPPEYLLRLNQGLNREVSMLKFSCLVLSRTAPRDATERGHVVISRLIREKGKCRLFLCSPSGPIEVYRLDRDKSVSNRAFDRVKSGDTVMLDGQTEKNAGLWRVESTTRVTVL